MDLSRLSLPRLARRAQSRSTSRTHRLGTPPSFGSVNFTPLAQKCRNGIRAGTYCPKASWNRSSKTSATPSACSGTRGFTAAARVALASGFGSNTAIFSIVNTVLLRPPNFPEPDRIVVFRTTSNDGASPAKFAHWRAQSDVVELVSVSRQNTLNWTGVDNPEQLKAGQVYADDCAPRAQRAEEGPMCVTALPMREGPSEPACRSRFQITFGCCGQKPWW